MKVEPYMSKEVGDCRPSDKNRGQSYSKIGLRWRIPHEVRILRNHELIFAVNFGYRTLELMQFGRRAAAPAAQREREEHETGGEPAGSDLHLRIGQDVIVSEDIEPENRRAA